MKFTILIGTLALAATTFTTVAHASAAFGGLDEQCFKALGKEWTSCNNGSGSSAKLPDFKFNMKSHGKSKKNNKDSNTVSVPNQTAGDSGKVNNKPTPPQKPSVVDNGHGHSNSGGNNTSPRQLNSNDIKGFDPFSGLYGPGT